MNTAPGTISQHFISFVTYEYEYNKLEFYITKGLKGFQRTNALAY
jgi:hypothetical protein